jgi:hypothetical protein
VQGTDTDHNELLSFCIALRCCRKRPITEGKETYYRRKRDVLQKEKRPITEGKETYCRRKRDLLQKEKRPITEGKETYYEE